MKNFFLVLKPGITFGNMISAAGGFFLASKGRADIAALLSTIVGISLVVGSGCVLNNYADRNMDRKMIRTRNRALANGLISPKVAVTYASILCLAGLALLWVKTNMLSLAVMITGFGIYAGVYSFYLKRNSVYATLIGSLAGAAPPLAGYCAVSHRFDLGAAILLSIFILWQMPHSYAIAIFRIDDYAAAAIPVLPVKQGLPAAKKHIIGYTFAFMTVAPMLTLGGYTGYGYFAAAATLGLSWLCLAWSGLETSDERLWAKKLFLFSILNIFLLVVMMSIDSRPPASSDMILTYTP